MSLYLVRTLILIIADKKAALEQQLAHIEKELKATEKVHEKETTILRALNNLTRHGCSRLT